MATLFYAFLKHIKYWRLNPDQDVPDPMMSPPDPLARVLSNTDSPAGNGVSGEPKPSHDVHRV
jgi:hypothetical protein